MQFSSFNFKFHFSYTYHMTTVFWWNSYKKKNERENFADHLRDRF